MGLDDGTFFQLYYSPERFVGNSTKSPYVVSRRKTIPSFFKQVKLCNLNEISRLLHARLSFLTLGDRSSQTVEVVKSPTVNDIHYYKYLHKI